jgi:DNA-binding winged helix-turn-helix (wHTH) protein
MSASQNFLSGKGKYRFGFLLLTLVSLIGVALSMTKRDDFDTARREVLLRRIGHETLLQSGDSLSRVLPVEKISENEYQISFENDLSFQPDLLVNTTQRVLANDPLASDYVVKVLNCANGSVAYSYAIAKNKKDDIVACLGRKQPSACYLIQITFRSKGLRTVKYEYFLGTLTLLALGGFIMLKSPKSHKETPIASNALNPAESPNLSESPDLSDNEPTDTCTIGSILFDMKNQKLLANGTSIDLTGTEARILRIFALSPNEPIERSRLQKEIWEDEGVIVGRSLDMFISKLRKKLDLDPHIKISVIRGKGYKLEINS